MRPCAMSGSARPPGLRGPALRRGSLQALPFAGASVPARRLGFCAACGPCWLVPRPPSVVVCAPPAAAPGGSVLRSARSRRGGVCGWRFFLALSWLPSLPRRAGRAPLRPAYRPTAFFAAGCGLWPCVLCGSLGFALPGDSVPRVQENGKPGFSKPGPPHSCPRGAVKRGNHGHFRSKCWLTTTKCAYFQGFCGPVRRLAAWSSAHDHRRYTADIPPITRRSRKAVPESQQRVPHIVAYLPFGFTGPFPQRLGHILADLNAHRHLSGAAIRAAFKLPQFVAISIMPFPAHRRAPLSRLQALPIPAAPRSAPVFPASAPVRSWLAV